MEDETVSIETPKSGPTAQEPPTDTSEERQQEASSAIGELYAKQLRTGLTSSAFSVKAPGAGAFSAIGTALEDAISAAGVRASVFESVLPKIPTSSILNAMSVPIPTSVFSDLAATLGESFKPLARYNEGRYKEILEAFHDSSEARDRLWDYIKEKGLAKSQRSAISYARLAEIMGVSKGQTAKSYIEGKTPMTMDALNGIALAIEEGEAEPSLGPYPVLYDLAFGDGAYSDRQRAEEVDAIAESISNTVKGMNLATARQTLALVQAMADNPA